MTRRRKLKQSQKSPPTSDEALVARFIDGDRVAFEQLWAIYSPKIERKLSRELTLDAVDDALQEAACNAWQHRATFDKTKGDIGAWLFTIARNAACDDFKTRQLVRTNQDNVIDAVSKENRSAEGIAADNDLCQEYSPLEEAVRKIISSFTAVDQEIYSAGMHHNKGERWAANLAKQHSQTASWVRTKFSRLNALVQKELEDQGFSAIGGAEGDRKIRIVLMKLVEKGLGCAGPLSEEELHRIVSGRGVPENQEHLTSPGTAGPALGPSEYISTGIAGLNTQLGGQGLVQGWSVIIRGQPGTGKTTLVLHMAKHAIEEEGHSFVFASVEDDPEILLNQVTRSF